MGESENSTLRVRCVAFIAATGALAGVRDPVDRLEQFVERECLAFAKALLGGLAEGLDEKYAELKKPRADG